MLVFSDFDAAGSTAVATVDLVKDLGLSAATAAGAQVHDVWRGKELGAVGASGRFTTDALRSMTQCWPSFGGELYAL